MREVAARRVLIAGGGIGGLTAAIALKRAGFAVAVYERAPALVEVGAGLTIFANALRALRQIGLGHIVDRIGQPMRSASFLSWDGRPIFQTPIEALQKQYGVPMVAVHRADLQAALLAELGSGVLQTDATCDGFAQDDAQVRLRLSGGREATGDLLIGADGLRSVIRAQMFGAAEPRYAGYTAWRGIAHYALPAGTEHDVTETWGAGKRFGVAPLTDGRVYWFGTLNTPEKMHSQPGELKRDLLALFGTCHAPAPALIEATDESAILRNDIYDRPPLATWSQGRVTLLGDAAHPMTPNMGQGACQAIEDAVVLADCLSAERSLASALHAYEARRLKRANAVVADSRRIGRMGQMEQRWALSARDAVFRALPSSVFLRQLQTVLKPA
ncbi:MAG TPA: FAD-dependent monooxygenase [Ktedonobacterales bacterium]